MSTFVYVCFCFGPPILLDHVSNFIRLAGSRWRRWRRRMCCHAGERHWSGAILAVSGKNDLQHSWESSFHTVWNVQFIFWKSWIIFWRRFGAAIRGVLLSFWFFLHFSLLHYDSLSKVEADSQPGFCTCLLSKLSVTQNDKKRNWHVTGDRAQV